MFNPRTWRNRATIAEAETEVLKAALDAAAEQLAGLELRLADRAVLISMTRDGRINRFLFVRNGQMTQIETMGLMEDDWQAWKSALLEAQ